MFDFAWSEIALIGVVALIAIGPKDMPVAIKTVASMIKKARRMAGEFQTHVDEMVREANLDEVRNQFNELRNIDIKGEIEKAVDKDGAIRNTFADNPMDHAWTPPASDVTVPEVGTAEAAAGEVAEPEVIAEPEAVTAPGPDTESAAAKPEPPAFIPPEIANRPEPPAFIPPGAQLKPY